MDLVLKPRFFDIDSSQVKRNIYHVPFQRYVQCDVDFSKLKGGDTFFIVFPTIRRSLSLRFKPQKFDI